MTFVDADEVVSNLPHVAGGITTSNHCTIRNTAIQLDYTFPLCAVNKPPSGSNYHEINLGNSEAVDKPLRDFLLVCLQHDLALHVPATWSELGRT